MSNDPLAFPGTDVVLDNIVIDGFSGCVPITDGPVPINIDATFEADLSTDGGSTFTPINTAVSLQGGVFPIRTGVLSTYVGSTFGQTDPDAGFTLDILAAPTITVGDTEAGVIVGGGWEMQVELTPDGTTNSFTSDPALVTAISPPPIDADPCDWASTDASDANGDGVVNHLDVGDANLDGAVDAADLNELGLNWQQTVEPFSSGDFTGDGMVDAADLNILGVNWQRTCVTETSP